MDTKNWRLETIAVQAGYEPENGGPRVQPLVQSTTYKYNDAQSVADLFDLKREGFFYTRLGSQLLGQLDFLDVLLAIGKAQCTHRAEMLLCPI